MPIASGALGWPRSYWTPPPRNHLSSRRVYPVAEWARRKAEELKHRKLGRRKKTKTTENKRRRILSAGARRRLRKRCIIFLALVIVIVLVGGAAFALWWFLFKDNPDCHF